uniref:Uncharacterized protein n=1 Tax=Romanomermis culicivorax TaxID=13658 RepID=A0A915I4I8_ROMCU
MVQTLGHRPTSYVLFYRGKEYCYHRFKIMNHVGDGRPTDSRSFSCISVPATTGHWCSIADKV